MTVGYIDGKYYDVDSSINATQQNILYVGKHGSDENDGKTLDRAFLTFTKALSVAIAGMTIQCFDNGVYEEDLTFVDDVNFYAPSATLTGNHDLANCSITLGTQTCSHDEAFTMEVAKTAYITLDRYLGTSNSCLVYSETGSVFVNCNNALYHDGTFLNCGVGGKIYFNGQLVESDGGGSFCFAFDGCNIEALLNTGKNIATLFTNNYADTTPGRVSIFINDLINCTKLCELGSPYTVTNVLCNYATGSLTENTYGYTNWNYRIAGSGGSGSGTTITRTVWDGNLLAGIANAVTITHPAVADEKNKFVVAKQLLAIDPYVSLETVQSRSNSTYWTYDNLNTNSATWIDEGGGVGHFSTAPGSDVVVNCYVKINGVEYRITVLTNDGTGAGEVTLSGTPGANYSIDWIHCGVFENGIDCGNVGGSGPSPIGKWFTVTATASNEYVGSMASTLRRLYCQFGQQGAYTSRVKVSISKDGGTTWYSHNGTAWETMTKADWATKGIEYDFSQYRIEASDGTPMDETMWGALDADLSNKHIRLMVGFYCADVTDYIYTSYLQIEAYQKATVNQLPYRVGYGDMTQVIAKTISTTETLVYNQSNSTMSDVKVIVHTLS